MVRAFLRSLPYLALAGASLAGCSDDGDAGPVDEGNGLFQFEEGRAGRAVGIRAVVSVDGQTFETGEVEVALEPEGSELVLDERSAPLDRKAPTAIRHRSGKPVVARPFDMERQIAAMTVDPEQRRDRDLLDVCTDGGPVSQIGTYDTWLCWTSETFAAGGFVEETAYQTFVFYSPEGAYLGVTGGTNFYVPPDYHFSATHNFGCVQSPQGAIATAAWIEGLASLAYSFSLSFYTFGASVFIDETYGGIANGIQYDVGVSFGLGFALIPGIAGMSINTASNWEVGPLPIAGFDGECPVPPGDGVGTGKQLRAAGGPPAAIAASLGSLGGGTDSHRDQLREALAAEAAPLMEFLGSPTDHGPAYHVPAATNADLWDDFFAREGEGLCQDCVDTSLHGLVAEFADRVVAAGDDGEQIFAEGAWAAGRQLAITPELTHQGALQTTSALAVEIGYEVAEDLAAEARGDENRYVGEGFVELEGDVGAFIDFGLTATEIGVLIGVEPSAVLGATVTVDAGPRITGAELVLDEMELGAGLTPERAEDYLIRFTVDLSTAAGPLPSGAETWFVRPSPRIVRPRPGPAAQVTLGVTPSTVAGAPVTLMVEAMDVDYNYVDAPVEVQFFDYTGASIGSATGQDGFATLQFVPVASEPSVGGGEAVTLEFTDGSTGPGWKILGQGFSRDAAIELDGITLDDTLHIWAVSDSGSILIADEGLGLDGAAAHPVRVTNPHGLASSASIVFE